MYSTILHEWTHAFTQRHIDELNAILATLDTHRVKDAGNELLPEFYKDATNLTILNEIISNFVAHIQKPLFMVVMRGDTSIEEVVDGLIEAVKAEPFVDVIEAVMPIIKEDLTDQKERYNERIRETPIVIARWQEDISRNERSGEYSYSGLRRGGERGASAAYTGGERVDYRHSLEEIINTHSDEEHKAQMLALAQQMERDAESRGLDVAQEIADTHRGA